MTATWLRHVWGVLALFLIPIGGGIPAGVLLAQKHALPWPLTAFLYLVSDVILAFVFEPMMLTTAAAGGRVPFLARFGAALRENVRRTTELYGRSGGPFTLILVAFAVDPMTGRVAAHAAGHGFVPGWTFAIAGDMLYFGVIMACTLWLRDVLGDGTAATLIILAAMVVIPLLIKKWRERRARAV